MIENRQELKIHWARRIGAWCVHLFTATGGVCAILSLDAIHNHQLKMSLWYMAIAVFIDSVDGFFARLFDTKIAAPEVDGALLDNIIDYANYVIVPAFFIIESTLFPDGWRYVAANAIVIASAYQFAQVDAKTEDHFFKGFPSYWNIVMFYVFVSEASQMINMIIVMSLAVLVFVPIKYVYPSRVDFLSKSRKLRAAMVISTLVWMVSMVLMLLAYPNTNWFLWLISLAYVIAYAVVSLYKTFVPTKVKA